jgi:DNA-binding NarL/FixJ family response regulator
MESSVNYRFLIADDHYVVRQGVSSIVEEMFYNAIIYHSETFEGIIKILKEDKIDLLILEINFTIGDGLGIIEEIIKIQQDIKILVFTVCDENIYAMKYLNAGVSGYLNKGSTLEEMKQALSLMMFSGKYMTQNLKSKISDYGISNKPINPLDQLSNREVEVARLLIKGCGNLEITHLMQIKKSTVSTLKKRIFEKLEIDSLPALIEFFQLYFKKSH